MTSFVSGGMDNQQCQNTILNITPNYIARFHKRQKARHMKWINQCGTKVA